MLTNLATLQYTHGKGEDRYNLFYLYQFNSSLHMGKGKTDNIFMIELPIIFMREGNTENIFII